jgi:hypothetical protein
MKPHSKKPPQGKLSAADFRKHKLYSFEDQDLSIRGAAKFKGLNILDRETKPQIVPVEDRMGFLFKDAVKDNTTALGEKTKDYFGSYHGWNGPLRPEYDLQEPMAILDTEAYVKQALNRKLSLFFRNGFAVTGQENDVDYINKRMDTMSFVMNRTFKELLRGTLLALNIQSNCFWLKIRNEEASGMKKKKDKGAKTPIAGYAIIPAHMIQPVLKGGKLHKWRRYYETGKWYDEYDPDDIVHFKWDLKPGHIYGTPRLIAVRDDIYALRRLEENVEVLFINYLFPLYHVKVGTENAPCTYTEHGTSEIDIIKYEIENMPKEGVFTTDERTSIDVVGAKNDHLEFIELINHYKARIFSGLGVSAADMGEGGVTSKETDNISQNLKDMIKADGEVLADQLKMYVFKDLFMEATHSISVQRAVAETDLMFHEIDLDNKVKHENHVTQMYGNNLYTHEEARKAINKTPQPDPKDLMFDRQTVALVKATEKAKQDSTIAINAHSLDNSPLKKGERRPKKPAGKVRSGSRGGAPQSATSKKSNPGAKSVQNKETPTNQYKTKTSPKKDEALTQTFLDHLVPAAENGQKNGQKGNWKDVSSSIIDTCIDEYLHNIDDSEKNIYTNQYRTQIQRFKDVVGQTQDPEMLTVCIENWQEEGDVTDGE